MRTIIIRITCSIVCFIILYVIAFVSNRHYRENDDILFISKSQWKAIFLLMLPTLITIFNM